MATSSDTGAEVAACGDCLEDRECGGEGMNKEGGDSAILCGDLFLETCVLEVKVEDCRWEVLSWSLLGGSNSDKASFG